MKPFFWGIICALTATVVQAEPCAEMEANLHPDLTVLTCNEAIERGALAGTNLAEALIARGVALRALGQFDKSEADLLSALSIFGEDTNALRMLAWTYRSMGRPYISEIIYSSVLERDPHWQGWLSRCVVRTDLQKYEAAILDCDRALEESNQTPEAGSVLQDIIFFKALALNELRRPNQAYQLAQTGLDQPDISGRIFVQALVALWYAERDDEIPDLLAWAFEKYPNDAGLNRFVEVSGSDWPIQEPTE